MQHEPTPEKPACARTGDEPQRKAEQTGLVDLASPDSFSWLRNLIGLEGAVEAPLAPFEAPSPEELTAERLEHCRAELAHREDCNALKGDLTAILHSAFEPNRRLSWNGSHLRQYLGTSDCIFVVLKDQISGHAVGYTYGFPQWVQIPGTEGKDSPGADGIYIFETAIHPAYQGKGLVGKLMDAFEEECRARGFSYVSRDSAIYNGYADKVARHYGERVLIARDHPSYFGDQRRFIIRLN